MEAGLLNKGDEVLVPTSSANIGKEKLQNVTKHRRNVQVHSGTRFEPLAKGSQRFRFKPNSAEPFPTGSDANPFEPF